MNASDYGPSPFRRYYREWLEGDGMRRDPNLIRELLLAVGDVANIECTLTTEQIAAVERRIGIEVDDDLQPTIIPASE